MVLINLLICFMMILIISACKNSSQNQLQVTARPTTPAVLRKISPPPVLSGAATATAIVSNTQDGTYNHPSGTFSFRYPVGWLEDTSEYGSVFFSEPDGEGALYVTATNTGQTLNGDQFEAFVLAREENFFAAFDGYIQNSFEIAPNWSNAVTLKSLVFEDLTETVRSYYLLNGQGVYAIDMWWESEKGADYEIIYNEVLESFTVDPNLVTEFPYYNYVITFYDTLDAFSFEAPVSWRYHNRVENGVIIDGFSSPDENAFLEHIMFSIPEGMLEAELEQKIFTAAFAAYSEEPAKVVAETRTQNEDGWVSIDWQNDGSGWKKQTLYIVGGGKVLALNGVIRSGDEEYFQSTLDYAFDWYSVPAE